MKSPKIKAPAVDAAGACSKSQLRPQFSAKSTTTEGQRARILDALQRRPHSSYELRRMGCYQCPTRVRELRVAGYEIMTSRILVVDQDGYVHKGVALYSLVARDGAA